MNYVDSSRCSHEQRAMTLCPSCASALRDDAAICPHHAFPIADDWHVSNRILCDFFHRAKPIPRLPVTDREDDVWAHAGESA